MLSVPVSGPNARKEDPSPYQQAAEGKNAGHQGDSHPQPHVGLGSHVAHAKDAFDIGLQVLPPLQMAPANSRITPNAPSSRCVFFMTTPPF